MGKQGAVFRTGDSIAEKSSQARGARRHQLSISSSKTVLADLLEHWVLAEHRLLWVLFSTSTKKFRTAGKETQMALGPDCCWLKINDCELKLANWGWRAPESLLVLSFNTQTANWPIDAGIIPEKLFLRVIVLSGKITKVEMGLALIVSYIQSERQ